jgi:hypothetical protein
MKKLFLFSVIAFALSTVSCEKGQLKDLENPKLEELNHGNIKAEGDDPEETETTGILKSEIRIPSHG